VRRLLSSIAIAVLLGIMPSMSVLADVSDTQVLADAACNAGTMQAHGSVPETNGTGVMTPAHGAIPGVQADATCGHGL
jgi:hypothetical protein